jgi:polyferredoxin
MDETPDTRDRRPAGAGGGDRNPFPVFPGEPELAGPVKKSRMGRRRALVLGAVHLLVLAHVTHWLVTGSTVSPVEPSESMKTLELGQVNAGFVFLVLAILSSLVFGRFICGWACHLVALQDLCGWMMKKLGVRPRPFRSRLLVWAPVLLALYMFVWPTFRRVVAAPLLERIGWPLLGPPAPFPGFESHLVTSDFWATFPTWWVAIPFLLLCGFGLVYLLGSKAYCTYGCPYGPFFAAADRVAPARVHVTDACAQCGHCTAACTSNVKVHDEVREYGMVVDPGCMRCLDCVAVCPSDALYLGWGRPPVAKGSPRHAKPKRHFDLKIAEEVLLAALFAVSFYAWRSIYDTVPLLMTMGIAGTVTFLTWKLARLFADPTVRIQTLRLKQAGRLRRPGAIFGGTAILLLALTAQGFVVHLHRARAAGFDHRVTWTQADAMSLHRAPLPDAMERAALKAAHHYRRADRFDRGGIGLLSTPEVTLRRAWIAVVLERYDEAAEHLRRAAPDGPDGHRLRLDRARVLRLAGRRDEAVELLRTLVAEDPVDAAAHRELSAILLDAGRLEEAAAELVVLVNLDPGDRGARGHLIDALERLGRPEAADRYR